MEKQKKTELRIKVPQWISDLLKEHCELYGVSAVSTIVPLLVEYLGHPRVRDNCSNCFNNIYSAKSASSGKPSKQKRGTQIPDDFDPPSDISEKYGLDHQKAVSFFIDWAKGKGHTQVDWIATYRNACRTWIKEKMPIAHKGPIYKSLDHIPEYEDEEEF